MGRNALQVARLLLTYMNFDEPTTNWPGLLLFFIIIPHTDTHRSSSRLCEFSYKFISIFAERLLKTNPPFVSSLVGSVRWDGRSVLRLLPVRAKFDPAFRLRSSIGFSGSSRAVRKSTSKSRFYRLLRSLRKTLVWIGSRSVSKKWQ